MTRGLNVRVRHEYRIPIRDEAGQWCCSEYTCIDDPRWAAPVEGSLRWVVLCSDHGKLRKVRLIDGWEDPY